MDNDKLDVPKRKGGDVAHTVAKAVVSAIPGVGGPAAELFQFVIQPPLERRREEWMNQVAGKLRELEANGLKLESLRDNEEFVSAVMHASQAALRTHKAEKLTALRNAIANIAKGQAPDEATQHLYLDFVDSLTELHLQLLKAAHAPAVPPGMGMGGLWHVLQYNVPALQGHPELGHQMWRDLYLRGLVNTEHLGTTMSGSGLAQKRTTGLGDGLLAFISD